MNQKNLKPFYIQKGYDASENITEKFNLYMKSMQLLNLPKPKNIISKTWQDENGDEEFMPKVVTYESFDIDVSFAYVGDYNTAQKNIFDFYKYIQGDYFSIYDAWLKVGYRCRFLSYSEELHYETEQDNIVVFTMKFKVNDPLCYALEVKGNSIKQIANTDMELYFSDGFRTEVGKREQINYTFSSDVDNFVIINPSELVNRDFKIELDYRIANGRKRIADNEYRLLNFD